MIIIYFYHLEKAAKPEGWKKRALHAAMGKLLIA